jgi:hypothetical protein
MTGVTAIIDALAAGRITLDAAAADFRARQWPSVPRLSGTAADEVFAPPPEGSFLDVAVAYSAGRLTPGQYAVLAAAAAEAGSKPAQAAVIHGPQGPLTPGGGAGR